MDLETTWQLLTRQGGHDTSPPCQLVQVEGAGRGLRYKQRHLFETTTFWLSSP